jgi:putative endopeptidase
VTHAPQTSAAPVRPQDDLYGWANGEWLATATIPDDRSAYGAFYELVDQAEIHMREICEQVASGTEAPAVLGAESEAAADHIRTLVGSLYTSFLDADRAAQLGTEPLLDPLAELEGLAEHDELISFLGRRQRRGGSGLVGLFVMPDADHPDRNVLQLNQSGLGLPDESYYRQDEFAQIRTAYVEHIERLLGLAGDGVRFIGDYADAARRIMALETQIATTHWDRVRTRDAVAAHNPMSRSELEALAPRLAWDELFGAVGVDEASTGRVVVRQPSFFTEMGSVYRDRPIQDWKAWAAYRVVRGLAPYLGPDLVEEHFAFYGRTLSGTPQLRPRWKRAVSFVEGAAGEAAGQLYVARHFPPAAKAAMNELVENVVAAYRRNITDLDWMGPQTREQALAKLEAFRPKVGYPDTWRDVSGLHAVPDDLVGNAERAAEFETERELAKIGKPVDLDEWLMTPQTVNAYYHPLMNEIVFPAAILQPPFFSLDAPLEQNYGGIGAVIGHEIGHGFDDQGSRYDGNGALRDWWTAADREKFEKRSNALIAQFDVLEPRNLPGHTVNGALTVGENIGDLGGVSIALQAYRLAVGISATADDPEAHRRFFHTYATIWRSKVRPEEEVRRLTTDPHSPAEFRANIVRNVDAFHEAFDVDPGDGLWLDGDDRVHIW